MLKFFSPQENTDEHFSYLQSSELMKYLIKKQKQLGKWAYATKARDKPGRKNVGNAASDQGFWALKEI